MRQLKPVKNAKIVPLMEEILDKGTSVRFTVTGMSMYPFLRENKDSVELSRRDFQGIHRGDVVFIRRNSGEYILHRVIRKEADCFFMVGDAQQWIEGPVQPYQLIAVATAVWRLNRKISCNSFRWRFLSLTWLKLLRFRPVIVRTYGFFRRMIPIKRRGSALT